MTTPTQAILWQLLWRSRFGLAGAAVYLLVAIGLSHFLTPYIRTHWGDDGVATMGLALGVPCALVLCVVVAAFSNASTSSAETSPPSHMLVLPLTTRKLVDVPMAAGALAIATVWLVIVGLVLRPNDVTVPLLWPAAALVLFLATFQALAWTPFVYRWIQSCLLIVIITLGAAVVMAGLAFGIAGSVQGSDSIMGAFVRGFGGKLGTPAVQAAFTSESFPATALIAACIPLAYLAALSGVAMARRGDAYDCRPWNRFLAWLAAWRKPSEHSFSSPLAAQVWFECRTCGWYLPLIVGCIAWYFPFIVMWDQGPEVARRVTPILLALPLLFASVGGSALGSLEGLFPTGKTSNAQPSAFLFVRPLNSTAIFRGKILMALFTTVVTWLIVLLCALPMLRSQSIREIILAWARTLPAWQVAATTILAMPLALALTWSQLVKGLWIAFTGREWMVHALLALILTLFFLVPTISICLTLFPEYRTLAWAAVPWLGGIAIALKTLAAAAVLWALDRAQLLTRKFLLGAVVGWLAVAICLSALALWLVPSARISRTDLFVACILLVPFSRLAGAPLAIEWNRYR